MSLLLLASMPAACPDGPSDAEEGERRRGINAPPENGQKKRPVHMNQAGCTAKKPAYELVSEVPALLSTAKWCDERRNNIWKQCDK